MQHDSLGDRIKRYEQVSNPLLTPRAPLFIRIDGKAFHTWTRHMNKPFDEGLISAMVLAAQDTAGQMQGFKLGYIQSDEATFVLTDYDTHQSQGWFGYELNKVVSVSASLFTGYFNHYLQNPTFDVAFFDARAFTVPAEDAPNVFIWRQQDWHRNSLQMLAREHFSHAELHGKKNADIHEMLHGRGVNWASLPARLKNGTFIHRSGSSLSEGLGYDAIRELIEPEVTA